MRSLFLLLVSPVVIAIQQAPALPGAQAISSSDRVYTADQTSNTITVVKPLTNEVLGTISLGKPRMTDQLNPQYLSSVNSHGLGFSLDGQYLSHTSVTTNTLTVVRTLDNTIVSKTTVDRASHESFFAHDGKTVWVACRGTENVNLVDAINGGIIGRVKTDSGPSKVLFSPDGKLAYVNHINSPVINIIDVAKKEVVHKIRGLGDVFSSDMMISADGLRLWAVHKKIGKTSIIDLSARKVVTVLDTGAESNHPNFATIKNITYGFLTVAATNETRVWRQERPSSIPVFVHSIPSSGVEPHGIWGSPDGTRMYIVNEHSDTLDVVDTSTMKVITSLVVGQESQALVYVAGAVPSPATGTENLGTQGLDKRCENRLIRVTNSTDASALFTIRQLEGLEMLQIIGRTLEINQTYVATAACKTCNGGRLQIVSFKATVPMPGKLGCAVAPQVLSFLPFFTNYEIESLQVGKA
ncbi:nitrous oxide reductase [Amylocarpus encephaloides]|uniref:Nitrous oxide reductase n=1 Tax=Amylocarpus encephaloides TaxID=45428 RepID=A0A9P7YCQ7_9HELO|nr:nitrous oxide reductase [Amylocarpus encephaloides]